MFAVRWLFVHGWGWDHHFWSPLLENLDEKTRQKSTILNLGFVGEEHTVIQDDETILCIGHSLGFLWLLMQDRIFDGYVSLCGFTHFMQGGNELRYMEQNLKRDPERAVKEFYQLCGSSKDAPDLLNAARLLDGLDWLKRWDGRTRTKELLAKNIPIVAVASRTDIIIPAAHSEDCFASLPLAERRWHEEGGHLLPVTHIDFCTEALYHCAERLR